MIMIMIIIIKLRLQFDPALFAVSQRVHTGTAGLQ